MSDTEADTDDSDVEPPVTIWSGPRITFEKPDRADFTDPANQDAPTRWLDGRDRSSLQRAWRAAAGTRVPQAPGGRRTHRRPRQPHVRAAQGGSRPQDEAHTCKIWSCTSSKRTSTSTCSSSAGTAGDSRWSQLHAHDAGVARRDRGAVGEYARARWLRRQARSGCSVRAPPPSAAPPDLCGVGHRAPHAPPPCRRAADAARPPSTPTASAAPSAPSRRTRSAGACGSRRPLQPPFAAAGAAPPRCLRLMALGAGAACRSGGWPSPNLSRAAALRASQRPCVKWVTCVATTCATRHKAAQLREATAMHRRCVAAGARGGSTSGTRHALRLDAAAACPLPTATRLPKTRSGSGSASCSATAAPPPRRDRHMVRERRRRR